MSLEVIRRLVTVLGFDVDQKGFDQAEAGIGQLKSALGTITKLFAGGAVAVGMTKLVEAASDVDETMNVLSASFGENTDSVVQWAKDLAGPIGRSQYMLREFAGATGAILAPMLGSREAAAEMSTTVSQLAVDLGSFFNSTDEEALKALQSGLMGSSEPLRRYGVVLLDATLKEFARARGIAKSVEQMTEAEKVQLRFQYIMEKTRDAQGDATNTADGYANATKALRGGLRDLAVQAGQQLLPIFEKSVAAMSRVVKRVGEVLGKSAALEMGFKALAAAATIAAVVLGFKLAAGIGAATVAAVKAAVAFKSAGTAAMLMQIKAALIGVAVVALIALLALLAEDLYQFFTGGDSMAGRLVDKFKELWHQLADAPINPDDHWLIKFLQAVTKGVDTLINHFDKLNSHAVFKGFEFITNPGKAIEEFGALSDQQAEAEAGMAALRRRRMEMERRNPGAAVSDAGNPFALYPEPSTVTVSPAAALSSSSASSSRVSAPINMTINAAPGMSAEAVGQAAGRSFRHEIEALLNEANQSLTPLAGAGAQ